MCKMYPILIAALWDQTGPNFCPRMNLSTKNQNKQINQEVDVTFYTAQSGG